MAHWGTSLFIATMVGLFGFAPTGCAAVEQPNVILIVLDAARADHFSSYGYDKQTTPHIDALAKEGVLFERHFSQATHTSDFLPRFFFSRYISLPVAYSFTLDGITIADSPDRVFLTFDSEQIFLTDAFSLGGYRTAFFDLGSWLSRDENFVKRYFDYHVYASKPEYLKSMIDEKEKRFIDQMVSWINKDKDKRFFLYWHIMYPHETFPPGVEDETFTAGRNAAMLQSVRKRFTVRKDDSAAIFNEEELACLRALYDSNLKHADTLIGELYAKLNRFGISDTTLFIITADHGENLGDHKNLTHGGLPWDSVTRVPLIMVCPSSLQPKVRVKGFTESIDVAPTLLELCGIGLPDEKSMDGISLLQFMRNPQQGKKVVYTDMSLRTPRYKYIRGFSGEEFLYDIVLDPDETNDIAKTAPKIKDALAHDYNDAMKPYIDRYERSIRKRPPEDPLYLPVTYFSISPRDAFKKSSVFRNQMLAFLKKTPPKKPWLLNTLWNSKALFRLPQKASYEPLTLTGTLLDARYSVELLLLSQKEITNTAAQLGFRYRFSGSDDLRYPHSIALFSKPGPGVFYYNLILGDVEVIDGHLSIEIDFMPPNDSLYALLQFKFSPTTTLRHPKASSAVDVTTRSEKMKEQLEHLKSLGYL